MQQPLSPILSRLRMVEPTPDRGVDPRGVARLEAELGRPLPARLKGLWNTWGAGPLGGVALSTPEQISSGLALSDRLLDEGLLPFAFGPDGEPWALRLDRRDDPEVVLAIELPRRLRAVLGPLARAIEVAALRALDAHGRLRGAERARLAALDADGRFREPARWATARRSLGA